MPPENDFTLPRRWRTIRPKFLIGLVLSLVFLGAAAGYWELTQSRKEILELMRIEAQSLIEAMTLAGESAAVSYGEAERLLDEKLQTTGEFLLHLVRESRQIDPALEQILQQDIIFFAFLTDRSGRQRQMLYAAPAGEADTGQSRRPDPFDASRIAAFLEPLFTDTLEVISGFMQNHRGELHYALALRTRAPFNRQSAGGNGTEALVLCTDPQLLLDFRRRIGIGRLIQDLGNSAEVAYIALQDEQGIIAASENVRSLSRIDSDPFLQQVAARDSLSWRIHDFVGEAVFEMAQPFVVRGERFGLLRVGLNMQAVEYTIARTGQRAVLVGIGLLIVVIVLINFLVGQQNYQLLTESYTKIKTYTGNILYHMADAVVAVDRHGKITLFNRAAEKMFAVPAEEAIGKSCRHILHGRSSLLDRALAAGEGESDVEVTYRLNGRAITLSVTTTVIRNAAGEIDSAVAVLKDLTEKKALEETLRRQEKLSAMGELASGVAHEVRNPLNSISMIAQRFLREFQPRENEPEFRSLARAVVAESRRVNEIIQRFLAFARPPKLQRAPVDLNALLRDTVTLVQSEAAQKGIMLRHAFANDLPALHLDGNQMTQVFLNLLQNSLHATRRGGEIGVRTRHTDGEILVEIEDTGEGIPEKNLQRIFDLYFTTKAEGTGMGLSIAHRIVTEHGGRIHVESKVGRGTKFVIILPSPTDGEHA